MASLKKILDRTVCKFGSAFEGVYAGIRYDRSILIQVLIALISIQFLKTLYFQTVMNRSGRVRSGFKNSL